METHPNPPTTERQRPGRLLGTIVRVTTREKGFIFCRLIESEEECFLHKSGIPPELWGVLEPGAAITCKVSETSKGLRGYEVIAGSDEDQTRVNAEEEFRGNRG